MSSFRIFDIAGSAMSAQSVRLSTVASNLANADSVTSDPNTVFHAHMPMFKASSAVSGNNQTPGVQVMSIEQSNAPPQKRYEPGNPMADTDGYVYAPNINSVEQMVDMISSSRSYQNSVEVMNTAKTLALKTLTLGS
jgi:flagellar basal-body rod protein FlgC